MVGTSRRKKAVGIAFVMAILSASLLWAAMPAESWGGGAGNVNMQYGDCSCHNKGSTATIAMSASKTSLAPSEQITITVTVTGGQGTGGIMGALILSKLSGTSGTLPSDTGWTIVTDPAGTKFNYVEKSGYTGSMTFTWTVKAPAIAGTYTLFAKIEHGPSGYTKDHPQGVVFTVAAAVTGPSIIIAAPSNGATVSGSISIVASVTAGTTAVGSVQLKVDGTVAGTLSTAPWTFTIDTTALSNGQHILLVTATDANAKTAPTSIAVMVNNAPLAVSITAPSNGASVKGSITIVATAIGPAAINYLSFLLDGVQLQSDATSPYSASLVTNNYADGQHTITVQAVDAKASVTEQKIVLVFNNTGTAKPVPAVTISAPNNGQQVSGIVAVNATVTSTLALAQVSLSIDGVVQGTLTAAPYQWWLNTVASSNGPHVLNVTARDTAGTVGFMSITINVQNQALQLTLRSPADGTMLLSSFNISGDVLFGNGALTATVLEAGRQIANASAASTFIVPVSGLSFGEHVLTVVVSDASGRNATAAVRVTAVKAMPSIAIAFPTSANGPLHMNATVDGPSTVLYVSVKVDGTEVANMTSEPYAWTIETTQFGDGAHEINITASYAGDLRFSRSAPVLFQSAAQAAADLRTKVVIGDIIIGIAIALIIVVAILRKKK